MPNYEYENTATGERFTRLSTWDDSNKFLEENSALRRVICAPGIVSGVGSGPKVDDGFKEVMSKMKDAHRVRGPQIDKWAK